VIPVGNDIVLCNLAQRLQRAFAQKVYQLRYAGYVKDLRTWSRFGRLYFKPVISEVAQTLTRDLMARDFLVESIKSDLSLAERAFRPHSLFEPSAIALAFLRSVALLVTRRCLPF
jgi:hypothetical protein